MKRIIWLFLFVRDILAIPLVTLMPRNKRKIIFGAWTGKQYGCNTKYLFEETIRRGGFDCYWIGEESLRDKVLAVPGAKFLGKGTLRSFWHCLTAGMYVYNIDWKLDIIKFPNCGRVKMFYTTHGYPDKLVPSEEDIQVKNGIRLYLHKVLTRLNRYLYDERSWFSASSPAGNDIRIRNEPDRLSYERILNAGLPRADFEIRNAGNHKCIDKLRAKYAAILGIDPKKRWYLYAPTWRHDAKDVFSFTKSSYLECYNKLLEQQGAVLIEKQHPAVLWHRAYDAKSTGNIAIIGKDILSSIDMQEIQLASDRLITDYSSVYYDTVLMNRPVIHFVYDYERFMSKEFGFAFDIRNYGGGPFVYTEETLLKAMSQTDEELLAQRSPRTLAEHLTYEEGHSCDAYYELFKKFSKGTDKVK